MDGIVEGDYKATKMTVGRLSEAPAGFVFVAVLTRASEPKALA
jgi:hypothetical protein